MSAWTIEKEKQLRKENKYYADDMNRQDLNRISNEIAQSLYNNRSITLGLDDERRVLRAVETYLKLIFWYGDEKEVSSDDD